MNHENRPEERSRGITKGLAAIQIPANDTLFTAATQTVANNRLDSYIARIISTAPPISTETADRIALILGGTR